MVSYLAVNLFGMQAAYSFINNMIMIIYVYQLGTGGRTQEAKPVRGVYP